MCGLIGLINKNSHGFSKDQQNAFNDLLYLDALRGMDSTGVFMVDNVGNLEIAKEASAATWFREQKEYKELLGRSFQKGSAMIGHNRAATKGVVNDENAHPFIVDNTITLVHNGTLYNHKQLADTEVDSHAIAHVIHENGDDVEKALQKINGAYALIWHDFNKDTVNFVRNSQRPLHWVETKDSWIWASEANMLHWIVTRYNFTTETEVKQLPENVLCTFHLSGKKWGVESKEIKPAKTYYPVVHQHSNPYANMCDYEPPIRHEAEIIPISERVKETARLVLQEDAIAKNLKINMPAMRFMTAADGIENQSYQVGICCDYEWINGVDGTKGYVLYAYHEMEPDILIKCFITKDKEDEEMMDLAYNNKRAVFKILNRQWRAYTDKSNGEGYGMLNSNSFKECFPVEQESVKCLG